MKKTALWKDIFREIWQTKARFFSIFAIIALGVGFFSGIKATGPNMLDTANHYYQTHHLMDLKVQSTYGLSEKEMDFLKGLPEVKAVEGMYTADLLMKEANATAKVYGYESKATLNQYEIVEGRLPEKSGEIALDDTKIMAKHYQIGDTLSLESGDEAKQPIADALKTTTYQVVGFVNSPQFIENMNRGNSSIGNGTTSAFLVVPNEDFNLPVYTEAYLTFNDTANLAAYTKAYDQKVTAHQTFIEEQIEQIGKERLDSLKVEAEEQIQTNEQQLEEGKKALADAKTQIEAANEQLVAGQAQYEQGKNTFEAGIATGDQQIKEQAQLLTQKEQELATNQQTVEAGQARLNEGQAALDQTKAENLPKIEQGQALLTQLDQLLALPLDQVSAAQQQQAIQLGAAYSPDLGNLLMGYFNGLMTQAEARQTVQGIQANLAANAQQFDTAQNELNTQQQVLENGRAQLAQGTQMLTDGKVQLAAARQELATQKQAGLASLETAKAELADATAQYQTGLAQYEAEKATGEAKLQEGEQKLSEAKKQVASMALPKYYVFDRSIQPGYLEFNDNADRITSLSTAFPVFFFLIAALVSLTTMTRMVEEQRLQIGTLKALGYGNGDILKKFLVYASVASIAASVVGLLVGFNLFPTVIFNAYSTLYNLPSVRIHYYASYAILSLLVALICTTATVFVTVRVELRANAASLMRPKAPKSGQRILLERIGFIWNRLSFAQKVTARNLFRYKQRMFMTILGVAGCTALILTGFGLRDSIGDVAPLQFGKVMQYQLAVGLNDQATNDEKTDYEQLITKHQDITGTLKVAQEKVKTTKKNGKIQDVTLFVPETAKDLKQFVALENRKTGKPIKIEENGAVITEKLAKMYQVKVGDKLKIVDTNNEEYNIPITGITENYVQHYLYLTPETYQTIFGQQPTYNTELLTYSKENKEWEDQLGESLLQQPYVVGTHFISQLSGALDDTMSSMNIVIMVLIVSAAALAFVVLYNLTNINVSERVRELSTIKVLGFYDSEVTAYIYRENILLSVFGIIFGLIMGIGLHRFVLTTAEVDIAMFSPVIRWWSYLLASALTLLFTLIVMWVMHFKLKKIDMIEALKAVE
ncbi:ABC transporter permease [Isobaculum melis]|uniref:Putative ABC transport system permease protein n=1 Tax=Isobaculum melis TaxID=142588 RepID=A0A1H9SQH7_9LACT|nr:ABC transporter permease [Isobaculum melis]SER87127.1 putative ABC transport system permease protein [Isobaculum melis]